MEKEIELQETIRKYLIIKFHFKDGTSCINAGNK